MAPRDSTAKMAALALAKAESAESKAVIAQTKQDAHAELCAVRYGLINEEIKVLSSRQWWTITSSLMAAAGGIGTLLMYLLTQHH